MKLKKLTIAAVIALGISSYAMNGAMAADCSPCKEVKKDCGCPIEKAKDDCGCNEKTSCEDECDKCAEKPSCDRPAEPTCASCATPEKISRENMKQVYSYPNAIYGSNNYVGEEANSITSAENTGMSDLNQGTTISSESNCITGAAAQIPYLNNEKCGINGVPVLRDEKRMDNNNCPIQIHTENSLDALKKSFVPFELSPNVKGVTGAAADLLSYFPDVTQNYWAGCDIDKLAMNDVVVGYPDRKFRPTKDVTRAEFATMLVKGYNLDNCPLETKCIFSDVPAGNWANPMIAKAVEENLLMGYPDGKFKPSHSVTRAEALTAMSKGLKCNIDKCKAEEILSKYKDSGSLPEWAQIPIATALESGALKDTPNSDMIMPNKKASRAEIASMLQNVRVSAGFDKNPQTANAACPLDRNRQAYVENQEVVKIPTLKLKFLDQVNAKSAHVGQKFAATTLEDVTIDGNLYPCGSKVNGKVIEVIRPNCNCKGALKLAFTEIEHNNCKAELPKQILTAQINKSNTPNPVARFVGMPLTWAGSLIGVTGRTAGGILSNLGNAGENISSGVGTAMSESFQGQFRAAGRSTADAFVETVKAPVDATRTALSGSMGLFQTTGDEVAYVIDPKGQKISAINPKEHVTIAFGCHNQ